MSEHDVYQLLQRQQQQQYSKIASFEVMDSTGNSVSKNVYSNTSMYTSRLHQVVAQKVF